MRYAARSTPGLSGTGSPSTRRSTCISAEPTWRTSRSSSERPGCGDRASGWSPSVRSTPKSRRISASASRAVASTAARSRASAAWSGPSRRRTAWVWMVTTLIEWDTMSCSSRAIRVRSSAAALAASSSRLRSSCSARARASSVLAVRTRRSWPTAQGPMKNTMPAARSLGWKPWMTLTTMNGTKISPRPHQALGGAVSEPTVKETRTRESSVVNSPLGSVTTLEPTTRAATTSGYCRRHARVARARPAIPTCCSGEVTSGFETASATFIATNSSAMTASRRGGRRSFTRRR